MVRLHGSCFVVFVFICVTYPVCLYFNMYNWTEWKKISTFWTGDVFLMIDIVCNTWRHIGRRLEDQNVGRQSESNICRTLNLFCDNLSPISHCFAIVLIVLARLKKWLPEQCYVPLDVLVFSSTNKQKRPLVLYKNKQMWSYSQKQLSIGDWIKQKLKGHCMAFCKVLNPYLEGRLWRL